MAGLDDPFVDDQSHVAHLPLEKHTDKGSRAEGFEPRENGRALPNNDHESRLNASHCLREKLSKILEAHPIGLNPEGVYLPEDEIDKLFNEDAIQSVHDGGLDSRLAEYMADHAKRTFATLLQVFPDCKARQQAMEALKANNFTDNELPSLELTLCYCYCRPRRDRTCKHYFPSDKPWDTDYLKDFKLKRWRFLVPKFETNIFLYEFDKNRLLPFTEKVPGGEISSGHFSDVAIVEMLASKQDKDNISEKTIKVVLKTLKRIGDPGYIIETEWRREAKAHKQMNGSSDNIIQAYAAIRQIASQPQNDAFHLVLEWADGGNLHDFWSENPLAQLDHLHVEESRQRVKEVLEQLWGLSQALERMHTTSVQRTPGNSRRGSATSSPVRSPERDERRRGDSLDASVAYSDHFSLPTFNLEATDDVRPDEAVLKVSVSAPDSASPEVASSSTLTRRRTGFTAENWRHGDIKPENILRFKNGNYLGVLKIADLGRAQQHLFVTKMRETKEKELWTTKWYEPPDLEEKNHKQAQEKISRLFDIWSMGCVIFEAALWMLYGYESFGAFVRANKLSAGELGATPYWKKGQRGDYELSGAATKWMNYILEHDPERNGAIGHLVKLVRDRLLQIRLPLDSDTYTPGFRTNAKDLREQLRMIIVETEKSEEYCFSGADRTNVSHPDPDELSTNTSAQSAGRSSLSPNDAGKRSAPDATIPISAPSIGSPRTTFDIELPKAWLKECDLKHGGTCAPRQSNQVLPRRLINVENRKKPKIIDTAELALVPEKTEYVALSHKWGHMPEKAVTTTKNIVQRKEKILIKELPASFLDAIEFTYALNCTYLWIDSLCILQGPDGDFSEQADTMQTTFSNAYCVLAACSAESATDGFLKDREPRCVKFGDVFVSAVTDDFERDVLHSPLNSRGWVLQERALARRTIFFTKTQMYWECTAFLGDSNFPDYTIGPQSSVGEQIALIIDLFQRYTRLEFSHPEDRPIAIDGLMDRLNVAFKTKSLAGLFETFWGRCLLWRKADGAVPMKKILGGTHTRKIPPTWSWMAFEGEISFIEPGGGKIDWNRADIILPDIILPSTTRAPVSWLRTSHRGDVVAIRAKAFKFEDAGDTVDATDRQEFYDGGKELPRALTKCVVIGSEKPHVSNTDRRMHYVMIVRAISNAPNAASYERVGVGYMLGKFIGLSRSPLDVTIE
ncbi:HET-domain-containing protein [Lophium mytilinum]|uniref:HET-domain-containing protein n=1 Tax=Lophium mytilinum TaxID=390894 RepID=A0A6A6QLI3_9PEZI|nr:HET-domain-containing protein [Lophium mytilinum]